MPSTGHYQARKAAGICPCGREPELGRVRCDRCLETRRVDSGQRRQRLKEQGLCTECAGAIDQLFPVNVVVALPRCARCIFRAFGRCPGNPSIPWEQLSTLFMRQAGRCALSGRDLILGQNASIDHIHPRSEGGPHVLANLQFLDIDVNKAKSALSVAAFVVMCRQVVERHDRSIDINPRRAG